MLPRIKYVPRSKMGSVFGTAYPSKNLIHIRDDLPRKVQMFIIQHEKYHLDDESTNWIWREIKANLYGARFQFKGFLECINMSLSFDRLKFYIKRFRRGW